MPLWTSAGREEQETYKRERAESSERASGERINAYWMLSDEWQSEWDDFAHGKS